METLEQAGEGGAVHQREVTMPADQMLSRQKHSSYAMDGGNAVCQLPTQGLGWRRKAVDAY